MARIKGVSLLNHVEFVVKTFGEGAQEPLWARIAPRSAETVRRAVAFEWYPLETISDLDLAIVQLHYGGDLREAWRMGAYSFEKHVTTIYRFLMHTLQTRFVFQKAGSLAARVVEGSTLKLVEKGERAVEAEMGGYLPPHPVFCQLVRGCMMGVLHGCGHASARVEHVGCVLQRKTGCLYDVTW